MVLCIVVKITKKKSVTLAIILQALFNLKLNVVVCEISEIYKILPVFDLLQVTKNWKEAVRIMSMGYLFVGLIPNNNSFLK